VNVLRPATFGRSLQLLATGVHLPPRVVTNADVVARGAPLTEEEIIQLSGIQERRWVDDEATSDLATAAARQALARADLAPETIARLVLATVSPDHMSPSAAVFVQRALGLRKVPSFDLTASCSGFLYALDVAGRAALTGDSPALAVAADVRSLFVDPTDRATCALFGDGAGAAILEAAEPSDEGIVALGLLADGEGAHAVYLPAGGSREPASADTVEARRHFLRMAEGPRVYLAAVEGMVGTAEHLLEAEGLGWDDVDWLVPHQPNRRILTRLSRLAGVPAEKVVIDIEERGNMSAASVAVALDATLQTRAKPGDRILLVAAGAGYTAGAALLVVGDELLRRVRG